MNQKQLHKFGYGMCVFGLLLMGISYVTMSQWSCVSWFVGTGIVAAGFRLGTSRGQ